MKIQYKVLIKHNLVASVFFKLHSSNHQIHKWSSIKAPNPTKVQITAIYNKKICQMFQNKILNNKLIKPIT